MPRQLCLCGPLLLTLACAPDAADLPDHERDEELSLVQARGWATPDAKSHLIIDEEGLRVGGDLVVANHQGELDPSSVERHLITSLLGRLADDDAPTGDDVLQISAYEDMPFSDLVDIVYTGGRAGYARYALTVASGGGTSKAILIEPPKFDAEGARAVAPVARRVTIHIGDEEGQLRYEVANGDEAPAFFDDTIAFTREVAALHAQQPASHTVGVTADADVTHGLVLSTLDLLAGPGCSFESHDDCWFSQPVILAG